MCFLKRIVNLPEELSTKIFKYVLPNVLVTSNMTFYMKYKQMTRNKIPDFYYDNYVKHMIRKDLDFIFNFIMIEYFDVWKNPKKYSYKNIVFKTYVTFLLHFARENEATKCIEIINFYMTNDEKDDVNGKRHKKPRIRNTKWNN